MINAPKTFSHFTSGRKNDASKKYKLRYAKTFELLFAYWSIKEPKALSASSGVTIKDVPESGDFDCMAKFQNGIICFEAKPGNVPNLKPSAFKVLLISMFLLQILFLILFLDDEGGDIKPEKLIS